MKAGKHKTLIVVGGATASGKTELAIRLAEDFKTEIVNADSRQLYREMSIGTAVPSAEERARAKHHLIQSHSIHQPLTANTYAAAAKEILNRIFEHHDVAVLCGGTGLYIRAVCEGLDPLPGPDAQLRSELEKILEEKGVQALAEQLKQLNPQRAAQTDLSNPARLIRAIEIERSKHSISAAEQTAEPEYQVIYTGIDLPREELYRRINRRVEVMISHGFEKEARSLYPHRHLQALQTVGYAEFFDYFDGKSGLDECISLIQQHTRNYAKRQLTWFRNQFPMHWFAPEQYQELKALIFAAAESTEK